MSTQHILFIEDEAAIRQMIRLMLEQSAYRVSEAEDAASGYQLACEREPDLILLDWMLPDMSGPTLLQRLRNNAQTRTIPVIMLTARGEENDMIRGLDAGADDYLAKPVSLKLLRARIKAQLRRSERQTTDEENSDQLLTTRCMTLDKHTHEVTVGEQRFTPGSSELKILQFFMQHPGRVFSRLQLLDSIWGQNTFIEERTVDVHVMRLRKQLKQYGVDKCIQTVRGSGYRFAEQACEEQ